MLCLPSIIRMTIGETKNGWSAKDWNGAEGAYQKIQGLLTHHQCFVDYVDPHYGTTALQESCIYNFPDITRLLLEYGANKNYQSYSDKLGEDYKGATALYFACSYGNLECVKILISWGCDPNLYTKSRVTPFHLSIIKSHYRVTQYLLSRCSNLKYTSSYYNTPLKTLLQKSLSYKIYSDDWISVHRHVSVIIMRMLDKGICINHKYVDNLINRLHGEYFDIDVEKITLFHLKNYSELFGLLWDSRQMWSPENHHTFSKADRKTISTFLLLHHENGFSKLHSDLWGIIFSYIIPRFPVSGYLHFNKKDS